MIQELREYSRTIFFKILMGIIAITFVLSFGVGGFFGDRKEVVAKVNDNEILLKEYREAYQNRLRALQQQFGENVEQIADQINLRQQVFDHLIDRYLLLTDTDGLNLIATDLEVQDHIRKQPFFQKNGQFDYNTYESILNQNRIIRHEYENSLRKDLLLTKKRQLLVSGVVINDVEVEQAYKRNFEKIELDYVFFDPQAFFEKTNITDDQLKTYYLNNKDQFKSLNKFRIEYFIISTEYFKDKLKVKEREIRRYYKKNIDSYVTPPEVKARHILVKIVPDAPEELLLEKQGKLKKILEKIRSGESFEELAMAHSEDGTSSEGGDLGWFGPGEMVPAFEDTAFSLEVGQVSGIIQSPFGLHLIKIEDRKEKITKSLEDVRNEIIVILNDRRAQKRLKEETDRWIGIQGESFSVEAGKLNKNVLKSDWFDSMSVIPKLGSASELASQLLHRKPGEIGVWLRNPVMGNVIYRLSEAKNPEIRIFEETKDDVFTKVRMKEATLIAIETAKKFLSKLKEGSSISKLIEKHELKSESIEITANSKFLPKIGKNKEFIKVGLNLNDSQKYGLSVSENRAYLIHFKNRTLDNENIITLKKKVRSQLLQNMQQALLSKELKRLRDSAKIEIENPMFRDQGSS